MEVPVVISKRHFRISIGGSLPDFSRAKVGSIWIRITYLLRDAPMAFVEGGSRWCAVEVSNL